jgi:beta-N-acetylhexosaminidase
MVFLHLIFFFFGASAAPGVDAPSEAPEMAKISLANLSLEQKVGQLFIFGFGGKKVTPLIENQIRTLKPGAFLLFGRNIQTLKQTSELNSELQQTSLKYSRLPLFLAVDQEGGNVSRIHTSPSLPSAYTIGNTNEPTLAFQAGKVTGDMLRTLGFNMNLAPVLDITDDKLNSFVGTRSFSESPHKISSMGVAFAQGLSEAKILPIAKHFPGHGPIALDTHQMTPKRNISSSELFASDLIPFLQFANSNFSSGIMVAHIAFPNIDKSELPATYSRKMVTDILSQQMKYKGLIMTDDIEMAGANSYKRIEDRAVAAIRAGNDLVMVGWSPRLQRRAVAAVIAAVKKGTLPMERINQSVRKILALKHEYAEEDTSRNIANTIGLKEAFKKIPYGSVFNEIIANYFKTLPGLQAAHLPVKKMQVISTSKSFSASFRRWIKNPNVGFIEKISGKTPLAPSDLIIFHVASSRDLGAVRDFPMNIRKNVILVSSHPKIYIEDKSSFLDVIEVYSNHPNLGGYMAEAINRTTTPLAAQND